MSDRIARLVRAEPETRWQLRLPTLASKRRHVVVGTEVNDYFNGGEAFSRDEHGLELQRSRDLDDGAPAGLPVATLDRRDVALRRADAPRERRLREAER